MIALGDHRFLETRQRVECAALLSSYRNLILPEYEMRSPFHADTRRIRASFRAITVDPQQSLSATDTDTNKRTGRYIKRRVKNTTVHLFFTFGNNVRVTARNSNYLEQICHRLSDVQLRTRSELMATYCVRVAVAVAGVLPLLTTHVTTGRYKLQMFHVYCAEIIAIGIHRIFISPEGVGRLRASVLFVWEML